MSKKQRGKNWNIIYIRDEAYKGGASNRATSETFYKRFDDEMVNLANFTIQMKATPKGQNDLIELKEEDLVNDGVYLLKTDSVYNDFQRNTSTSDDLIRESLDKFLEIQNEYKKLDTFIRHALLIQVDPKVSIENIYSLLNKLVNLKCIIISWNLKNI